MDTLTLADLKTSLSKIEAEILSREALFKEAVLRQAEDVETIRFQLLSLYKLRLQYFEVITVDESGLKDANQAKAGA